MSPMRERQDRRQCPQVKVTFGVVAEAAPTYILLLLSFCASLLSSSNSLGALKMMWRQASRPIAMSDQHIYIYTHIVYDGGII